MDGAEDSHELQQRRSGEENTPLLLEDIGCVWMHNAAGVYTLQA